MQVAKIEQKPGGRVNPPAELYRPTSEDMKLCAAIANAGGLTGAGYQLNVDYSTVFRRLNALEARLKARLFERFPEGYVATPAGERILQVAHTIAGQIDQLSLEISGHDLQLTGTVSITTTEDLAITLIAPILRDFSNQNPQVCVELLVGVKLFDISKREADVAVRFSPTPPENLVGRQVADASVAIYGTKDVLALAQSGYCEAPWVGWRQHSGPTAQWMEAHIPASRIVVKASNTVGVLALAEAGIGLALLPCFVGDRSGHLERLDLPPQLHVPLWVLTHPDLRQNAKVRALTSALAKGLQRDRQLLSGSVG